VAIVLGGVSRIGDAVMTLPALRTVSRTWPGEVLYVLAPGSSAAVYDRSGITARVIPISTRRGILRFFFGIRSLRASRCFLFSGGFIWALGAFLARIPLRAGLDTDARRYLLTHPLRLDTELIHQTESYQRVVALERGVVIDRGAAPHLVLRDGDREAAALFLRNWRERPYFAVNPSASHPSKRWPLERFVVLCRQIKERYGLDCLVLGGGEDQQLVGFLTAAVGGYAAIDLPLGTVFALLSSAVLYVGNNSGLSHAAAALGVPGVCLSGPSNRVKTAPRGEAQCFLGGTTSSVRERGRGPHPALLAVTVEEAAAAVASLGSPFI